MWSANGTLQTPTTSVNGHQSFTPLGKCTQSSYCEMFSKASPNKERITIAINGNIEGTRWDTLHRDVNTFVEFEQLTLLTEAEHVAIIRRSMESVKQRIWFLGRDPERRIQTCLGCWPENKTSMAKRAYEQVYHDMCHQILCHFVNFISLIRRIKKEHA